MVRDHPNRHEPFAQRKLGILKDGPDLDREPLAAFPAFECLAVGEMIDAVAAAMRAELTVTPADRPEMIDASLFVREGVHEIEQAVKNS